MRARPRVTWRWNASSRWRQRGVLAGLVLRRGSFLAGTAPANDVRAWGVLFALMLAACRPAEFPPPCDSMTLEQVKLDCRAQVRTACNRTSEGVDPKCPVLVACDKRIDNWHACSGSEGAAQ